MTQKVSSWRLLLLLPAALLFAFGGFEIFQHLAVLEQAKLATRPLPLTMYGEHSGMAVASFALGLAFLVGALRGRVSPNHSLHPSAATPDGARRP
jgi:hypothetical protein